MEGRKGVKWPCLSNVLTIYGVSEKNIKEFQRIFKIIKKIIEKTINKNQ